MHELFLKIGCEPHPGLKDTLLYFRIEQNRTTPGLIPKAGAHREELHPTSEYCFDLVIQASWAGLPGLSGWGEGSLNAFPLG